MYIIRAISIVQQTDSELSVIAADLEVPGPNPQALGSRRERSEDIFVLASFSKKLFRLTSKYSISNYKSTRIPCGRYFYVALKSACPAIYDQVNLERRLAGRQSTCE